MLAEDRRVGAHDLGQAGVVGEIEKDGRDMDGRWS